VVKELDNPEMVELAVARFVVSVETPLVLVATLVVSPLTVVVKPFTVLLRLETVLLSEFTVLCRVATAVLLASADTCEFSVEMEAVMLLKSELRLVTSDMAIGSVAYWAVPVVVVVVPEPSVVLVRT
jgi:hypothetical protein